MKKLTFFTFLTFALVSILHAQEDKTGKSDSTGFFKFSKPDSLKFKLFKKPITVPKSKTPDESSSNIDNMPILEADPNIKYNMPIYKPVNPIIDHMPIITNKKPLSPFKPDTLSIQNQKAFKNIPQPKAKIKKK